MMGREVYRKINKWEVTLNGEYFFNWGRKLKLSGNYGLTHLVLITACLLV